MAKLYVGFQVLIILALFGFGLWRWLRPKEDKPYEGREPVSVEATTDHTLSIYGDVVASHSRLDELLTWVRVDNRAVVGSALTDIREAPGFGLDVIYKQVEKDPSKVLLMRYGLMDALFGRSLEDFRKTLVTFVLTCRELDKIPVLCGLSLITAPTVDFEANALMQQRRDAFNNALYEVASRHQTHFIDLGQVECKGELDLINGRTPTAEYSDRLDNAIANYFIEKVIFY